MAISKNNVRIAVVEDDDNVRETFIRILKSDGYEVSDFASGDDFLKRSSSHAFQCIILDLEMPGADGIAVLEKLKASANPQSVIVVSGSVDPNLLTAAVSEPTFAILKKPVSVEELLDAVKNALL